jgi:hydrogenase nickel incorporation protein HypA/HybF
VHELGITQSIVAIVEEAAAGRRVLAVTLEVGALAGVDARAIEFCFELIAKGTAIDGARLEIHTIPGRGRCRACGAEQPMDSWIASCPCGAADLTLIQGSDLRVKTIETVD